MNKDKIKEVLVYLPIGIRSRLEKISLLEGIEIEEVRLRANAPLTIGVWGESCFITPTGGVTNHENDAYRVTKEELQGAFFAVCENSVYAHMEELRQGFITLKGGHRVGICGRTICENGEIKTFREVSSLNFRIARQIIGIADSVIDMIIEGSRVDSTLIISPPQMGKTTLLRDLTRQISNRGFKTAVADDRGEIGAMYGGVPENDVGAQTDIIDNAPKGQAILMLLRTMSPRVIISDEIAAKEDADAICLAHGTGVSVIATTHGESLAEVKKRLVLKPLFEMGVFKKAIIIERDFSTLNSITYTKMVNL